MINLGANRLCLLFATLIILNPNSILADDHDAKSLNNTSSLITQKTPDPKQGNKTAKAKKSTVLNSANKTDNLLASAKSVKTDDTKNLSFRVECFGPDMNKCNNLFNSEESDKLTAKDILVIAISTFALLVSLGSLIYNFRKDIKSRLRSINDEFWIRKIVSPVSIEPLIKDVLEVASNLPNEYGLPNVTVDQYDHFLKKYHPKIQQLSTNLQALKLLDNSIYLAFQKGLTNIEDVALEYCGVNIDQLKNGNKDPITRKVTEDKIIEEMILILKALKTYQTKNL